MYPDVLGPSCCYASMPVEVHSAITIDDDQRAGVSHSSYCMCEAQASRFRGSKAGFWNNPIWWWLWKGSQETPLVSCRFHLWFASPMWGQKHWRRLSDQQPCLPSLLFLCFASLPLWGGGASGDGTWVAYSCHCKELRLGSPWCSLIHCLEASINLGIIRIVTRWMIKGSQWPWWALLLSSRFLVWCPVAAWSYRNYLPENRTWPLLILLGPHSTT